MDDFARAKLVQETAERAAQWYVYGKRNNLGDIAFTTLTVAASLVASILGGTDGVPKVLVAAFAALPAAITTLQRAVNFRGRANWYFRAGARMKALRYEVEYAETVGLEQLARKRGELEVELESEWGRQAGGDAAADGTPARPGARP